MPNQFKSFMITPLGAAVVEALPDRKMVRKIERDFKRLRVCPMSELFNHTGITEFYGSKIIPMPQHLYRSKLVKEQAHLKGHRATRSPAA